MNITLNIVWNTIRKPLVWKPIFVLGVFSFNFFMDHDIRTIVFYTGIALFITYSLQNPSAQPYVRKRELFKRSPIYQKSFAQEASDRRLILYGSRGNYSMYDRNRMFGRKR